MGNKRLIALLQLKNKTGPTRIDLQGNLLISMLHLTHYHRLTLIYMGDKFIILWSCVSLVASETESAGSGV